MKKYKKVLALLTVLALIISLLAFPADAKGISSERADNVFFYATNAEGKSVLLKVMPLSDLKTLAHGQADGGNYAVSSTDNYPATQYCEAKGFTIPELVDYVKNVTTVSGASALDFSGEDALYLMATDSYGNYSRFWTYDELYGVSRYYFEGLYESWNSGWEVAGEENSKTGLTLSEYNAVYKASDPYYSDKRAVFSGGVATEAVLATESYSGRAASDSISASTEPGIASYIAANGGTVKGSLKNVLTDDYALRLVVPMTEADLMTAHRTAYDNFKWIYNMRLDMADAPAIVSLGTVAEAAPVFSLSGNTLTIAFTCATTGASIYYGDAGAPQTLYTKPITIDVTGRDLNADPVTFYATAVKEGWDDAGVVTCKYPAPAPTFKTVYSGMTGASLTFTAADGVSAADWKAWTGALNFITVKAPGVSGYVTVDKSKYSLDAAARTVTFDDSLFTATGSYSFIFHNTKYADKSVSVTIKQAAPEISVGESLVWGTPITAAFSDSAYGTGLSVYVTPEGGARTMISSSCLDRTVSGQVTVKAEYFTLASTSMPGAGVYTLELVNSGYLPSSQTVTVTLNAGFKDVPAGAWYFSYVTDLAGAGVINGVGNALFDPSGTLTWGQSVKLLLLSTGHEIQPPTGSHWASGYMDYAAAAGIIGKGLDPDAKLTRLEFCRAAAKALGAETTLEKSPFSDTADPCVLALNELGIIDGVGDGLFLPDTTLTRAQISKIIWCIMNLEEINR